MSHNINSNIVLLIGTGPMAVAYAKVLQGQKIDFQVIGRGVASAQTFYEETGKKKYHEEIDTITNLEQKIQKLVEIRTREGYMAEYSKNDEGYLLVENHCPICAAATICQGFCSSELNTFKSVLGKDIVINRVSHIIGGDRRCAYQITCN